MEENHDKNKSTCSNCFASLGVPSRMDIYKFLKKNGKSNVSKIVGAFNLTQPTISYHLKEMRDSGILISNKTGKEVYYDLSGHCPSFNQDCVLNNLNFPK